MNDPEERAARETLRRLYSVLDEPPFDDEEPLPEDDDLMEVEPPTDAEAREMVARMGVDIPALAARIRARVSAHEAAHGHEGGDPQPPGPDAAPAIPPAPPPAGVKREAPREPRSPAALDAHLQPRRWNRGLVWGLAIAACVPLVFVAAGWWSGRSGPPRASSIARQHPTSALDPGRARAPSATTTAIAPDAGAAGVPMPLGSKPPP